jgi:hypothetical protein
MENELKKLKKMVRKNNENMNAYIKNIYGISIRESFKTQESLIKQISKDYDLPYKELCKKYLKRKSKKYINKINDNFLIELDECSDEDTDITKMLTNHKNNVNKVFDKMTINSIECYVENKEGGFIYNKKLEKLGEISDGKPIFY